MRLPGTGAPWACPPGWRTSRLPWQVAMRGYPRKPATGWIALADDCPGAPAPPSSSALPTEQQHAPKPGAWATPARVAVLVRANSRKSPGGGTSARRSAQCSARNSTSAYVLWAPSQSASAPARPGPGRLTLVLLPSRLRPLRGAAPRRARHRFPAHCSQRGSAGRSRAPARAKARSASIGVPRTTTASALRPHRLSGAAR